MPKPKKQKRFFVQYSKNIEFNNDLTGLSFCFSVVCSFIDTAYNFIDIKKKNSLRKSLFLPCKLLHNKS